MSAIANRASCPSIVPAAAIERLLAAAQRVLVVTHIDPDGDAIGTQLAFGEYLRARGKTVTMLRDSDIPDKYEFLPGVTEIVDVRTLDTAVHSDVAVILECPNLQRIGAARSFVSSGEAIINIDHHRDNSMFGEINWVDTQPSSVGEMAFELFREIGFPITPTMAECLYTAILTDTGRFRFSSTSPRTMSVAGELIAIGADPRKICDLVYFSIKPSTLKLMGKVLNGIEYHHNGRIAVLTLTRAMLVETGATESESDGLVDFTLYGRGVQAGVLIKEIDASTTKASLRSANGINVAALAARFGGGGHYNAAGCSIPLPLDQARTTLVSMLMEADNGLA